MTAEVFDTTPCSLGEGVFWHPERAALFWFDIIAGRLYERGASGQRVWDFGEPASAAARMDDGRLLVATASGLLAVDLETGDKTPLASFPKGPVATRSNDGRADRQGGFWIGTMGLGAEREAGALYRYYKGELRKLMGGLTIPNGIAFPQDGSLAYFTDTMTGLVWRQALDAEGWPTGEREVYLNLKAERLNPDGAVVDAAGNYHSAQWGAHRVAVYNPAGEQTDAIMFGPSNVSCPAFGGADMNRLFVTTAREGLSEADLDAQTLAGQTLVQQTSYKGLPEPVIISA